MTLHLRSFTLLLCLCALALRVSGMHVHVPIDHDDSQQQAHIAAFDLHQDLHQEGHLDHHAHDHDAAHEDAADDQHQHVAVDLDSQAVSKKPGADLGFDALLHIATLFCLLLASGKLILPPVRLTAPLLQRLVHLRPPLRGPPLHA